jgi:expansin (peptidoglycan-binding protein)
VVTVAAIGVSTLHFVTAACAAARVPFLQPAAAGQAGPPLVNTVTQGRAYFYNPGSGQGTCSFGRLPANGLYVSLGPPQYAAGSACGSYVDVTGPAGTVRAEVVDSCTGCTHGGIDMSEAAFSRVANPAAGTAVVSYRLARDPRLPGPLAVRVAPSATSASLAVQVINHGNPLSSVAVGVTGPRGRPHWQPLGLRPDDYWVAPAGAGAGPFHVQVTDIFGHQVVLLGIRLAPGALQRTTVLMYSASAGGQQPSAAPASGPASPSGGASSSGPASPSGGASPSGTASPPGAASASGTAAHGASRSSSAAGPGC